MTFTECQHETAVWSLAVENELLLLKKRLIECAKVEQERLEILYKIREAMLQKDYEKAWCLLQTIIPTEKQYELTENEKTLH